VRFRWFTVVAASTALVAVGAQAASAKVPPQQMTRFHALEVAFFGPQAKWSNASKRSARRRRLLKSPSLPRLHPGSEGLRHRAAESGVYRQDGGGRGGHSRQQ